MWIRHTTQSSSSSFSEIPECSLPFHVFKRELVCFRRGWQFGCGKQDGALGDLSSIKLHSGPPVYDYTGGVGAAAPHKGGGAGGGGTQHPHSQHTYSSGYGSDALLMDTTHPLDLRYACSFVSVCVCVCVRMCVWLYVHI